MLIIIVHVVAYNLFTLLQERGLLVIRLSRLDRKNPSAGLAKFYAQRQKARKPRAEPNSFGFCQGAADFIKILWIISRQLCMALQYHDAR